MTRRKLAERIAERLFRNGQGQRADRLVLTLGGDHLGQPERPNLGGWGFLPAVDQIEEVLRLNLKPASRRAKARP